MWFFFGFVSFFGFFIWSYIHKQGSKFKSDKSTVDHKEYLYRLIHYKSKPKTLYLGVQSNLKYAFSFKKESFLDKIFKGLSISKEFQLGDEAFDKHVYVSSDDPSLHKHLQNDKMFSDAILKLMESDLLFACTVKKLELYNGRLWLEYKCHKGFEDSDVRKLATQTLPQFEKINSSLKEVPARKINHWKDPKAFVAMVILVVSSSLAINGVWGLLHVWWGHLPMTLETSKLLDDALLYGSYLVGFLILVSIIFLGRSAKTHLVILELITVGYFGSVTSMYAQLRDYNMEADFSDAQYIYSSIQSKRKKHSKKGGTFYFIYVKAWKNNHKNVEIEVSSSVYYDLHRGRAVKLKEHSGSMGYPWIESIEYL